MYKNIQLDKRMQLESQTLTMRMKRNHELVLFTDESYKTMRDVRKIPLIILTKLK